MWLASVVKGGQATISRSKVDEVAGGQRLLCEAKRTWCKDTGRLEGHKSACQSLDRTRWWWGGTTAAGAGSRSRQCALTSQRPLASFGSAESISSIRYQTDSQPEPGLDDGGPVESRLRKMLRATIAHSHTGCGRPRRLHLLETALADRPSARARRSLLRRL
jgi:hypothetical protein